MAVAHPEFLSLGGNTGIANSFASIDPSNLTDAAYNSGNLLQGNNALCYGCKFHPCSFVLLPKPQCCIDDMSSATAKDLNLTS